MSTDSRNLSRRALLKSAAAVGVGSILAGGGRLLGQSSATAPAAASAPAAAQRVPTRVFGRTGEQVSVLGLGGIFDITTNQRMLQMALHWGVTHWDTADCYTGGKSESGIGMYFERKPEDRKKVYVVTKSCPREPEKMTELLARSLQRMKTDYVDMYYIHNVDSAKALADSADAWKAWAETNKKSGKIRHFGFSTHTNMAECMSLAATLGWVDGIMTSYNFRLMGSDSMKRAVDACQKAGIGLTAMKTAAELSNKGRPPTDAELEMLQVFMGKGFSQHQAAMKAVWANEAFANICSQMPSVAIMTANIAAAMDKTALSSADMELLHRYAASTCRGYCSGCTKECQPAAGDLPIGDVLRYVMYHDSYGDRDRARQMFAELPASVRRALASADYSAAQRRCPNGVEIGELMRYAGEILG